MISLAYYMNTTLSTVLSVVLFTLNAQVRSILFLQALVEGRFLPQVAGKEATALKQTDLIKYMGLFLL